MHPTDLERSLKLQTLHNEAALERMIPRTRLRSNLAGLLHRLAAWLEREAETPREVRHVRA